MPPVALLTKIIIRPEVLAEIGDSSDRFDELFVLGLVAGAADQYVVTEGPMKGMRGYFAREADGRVAAINLGGRRLDRG